MPTEHFVRNSDNQIKLTLTEDGIAITGAWTELDIFIAGVEIHRDADADGVELNTSTGLLTLTPGDMTTDEKTELDALSTLCGHRVKIVVYSVINDDGAVFGADGSERIIFMMVDKPD